MLCVKIGDELRINFVTSNACLGSVQAASLSAGLPKSRTSNVPSALPLNRTSRAGVCKKAVDGALPVAHGPLTAVDG